MQRIVASVVALVVLMGIVFAVLGQCDDPPDGTDAAPVEPVTAPAVPAQPAAARPRIRAVVEASEPAAPRDPDDESADDGVRYPVRLRVVAEATRAPVAGAEVVVEGLAGVTDADGRVTIEGLTRGGHSASVRARGFAHASEPVAVPWPKSLPDIALVAGVVVPVEVVDAATGRPLAGATVEFLADDTFGRNSSDCIGYVHVVTDAAGRAETCLPADTAVPVMARAPRHVLSHDFVRTGALGAPQPTLRVALAAGGTVRGVVSDPGGRPVAGAEVGVRSTVDDVDGELRSGKTGADGAYAVDGLVLGASYVASVGAPWDMHAALTDSQDSAPIVPTREHPDCVADLRLLRPGAVDVEVVGDDGEALTGVFTRLVGESTESSRSGGNGSLRDLDLAPGRYSLRAWTIDRVPVAESVDVAAGATVKRRIVLTAGESISGTVVDEAGEPVADVWIRPAAPAVDKDARRPSGRTGEDGHFSISPLAKGANDLIVDPPNEFEVVLVPAVSAPSENVRFVVRRRGTLSLHAMFEDDARPAPDARIAFHAILDGEPWDIDRDLPTDCRFEVEWPAAVHGDVGIAVDGFLPVTRGVSVPAGAAVDLGEVRFRRACEVRGVLRDADGKPQTNCRLYVRGVWRGGSVRTDERGRFVLCGFPPGSVRIDTFTNEAYSFRVDVPRREDVVLTLARSGTLQVVPVDAAGAPLVGRRVVVRDAEGEEVERGTTDVNGSWQGSVAPGRVLVEIENGPHAEVDVRPGDFTLVKLR